MLVGIPSWLCAVCFNVYSLNIASLCTCGDGRVLVSSDLWPGDLWSLPRPLILNVACRPVYDPSAIVCVAMTCLLVKGRWCCSTHTGSGWCHCVGEVVERHWSHCVQQMFMDFQLASSGQSIFHWEMGILELNRMALFWGLSLPA